MQNRPRAIFVCVDEFTFTFKRCVPFGKPHIKLKLR